MQVDKCSASPPCSQVNSNESGATQGWGCLLGVPHPAHRLGPGLQVLPPQQPPKPPDQSGSILRWSTTGTDWKRPRIKVRFFYAPCPIHRGANAQQLDLCSSLLHPPPDVHKSPSPAPGVTAGATINQQVSKPEGIHQPLLPTAWSTHSVLTFGWACSLSSHCLHLPVVVIPWQPFLECPPHTWLSVRGWEKGELETHSLPSWSLPILFTLRNSRLRSHATTYVKSFLLFEVGGW